MTLKELLKTLAKDPFVFRVNANYQANALTVIVTNGVGDKECHEIKAGDSFDDLSDWIMALNEISINAVREFCSNKKATFDFNDYAKQAAKLKKFNLRLYEEALFSMYKAEIYTMLASTEDHVLLPVTNDPKKPSEMGFLAEKVLINGGSPKNILTKLVNALISKGWDIDYYGYDGGKATVSLKHPLFDKPEDD